MCDERRTEENRCLEEWYSTSTSRDEYSRVSFDTALRTLFGYNTTGCNCANYPHTLEDLGFSSQAERNCGFRIKPSDMCAFIGTKRYLRVYQDDKYAIALCSGDDGFSYNE